MSEKNYLERLNKDEKKAALTKEIADIKEKLYLGEVKLKFFTNLNAVAGGNKYMQAIAQSTTSRNELYEYLEHLFKTQKDL